MTRYFFYTLAIACILFTFLINCSSSNSSKETIQDVSSDDSLNINILAIIRDSVKVYSEPDGNIISFKLNKGDGCNVVLKGKHQVFDNSYDYWYNIDFQGKRGWVFGSYTSLSQNNEFKAFLRIFSKQPKEIIPDSVAKNFLNGQTGFIPMEYKSLGNERYAALFYKSTLSKEVEILLIIYKSGIALREHVILKKNINDCIEPYAFFTSKYFIKLISPMCGLSEPLTTYIQILDNNEIKELKSLIIAKSTDEILPRIKAELQIINQFFSEKCYCNVHSKVDLGFSNKEFIIYSIHRDECDNFCNSTNYSLIALADSIGWFIKFEEKGVFDTIFESGITNKYILVLKETKQKHFVEKTITEHVYLFDPTEQSIQELNLKSETCIILAPEQYGCKFCLDNTSHLEELIFKGNPVAEVEKKIANIYYDQIYGCKEKWNDSHTEIYKWDVKKSLFVKK